MKLEKTWDFVEAYYPNYYTCSDITYSNDLQKIIDGEIEGVSEKIYNAVKEDLFKLYGKGITEVLIIDTIKTFLAKINGIIYEKAIQGYIAKKAKQVEPKSTYFLLGSDSVRTYHDEGIEGVIKAFISEDGMTDGATFVFVEGQTSIMDFADALSGWFDYTEISKEEYEKLNS